MSEPRNLDEVLASVEAVAAENFGAAIGKLIRAVDAWEKGEPVPPAWALEARDMCIHHMEFLADQQGGGL